MALTNPIITAIDEVWILTEIHLKLNPMMGAFPDPEEVRLRYKYRSLIMKGKIKLPPSAASKLIGPDCAYHLYSNLETSGKRGIN